MTDIPPPRPSLPWNGGCRCGRVRFRITAPPLLSMACHCTGCQRMTASAFSLTLAIPKDGFEITAGETVEGGLHGPANHRFCPWCMSWMFTQPEFVPHLVNVRTTMLDDPQGLPPFVETYTSEKLAWATTPATHSFEKFPELDAWESLTADYRRQAG